MTLEEIKAAVAHGKTVHWSNEYYTVICDKHNQWMIKGQNGHCIGLTWADGETMNGKPEEFYIAGHKPLSKEAQDILRPEWEAMQKFLAGELPTIVGGTNHAIGDPVFFCKDESGRGGSYSIFMTELVEQVQEDDDEFDDEDEKEEFLDWIESAEVGDEYTEFNNRTYTRTA